MKIFSKIIFNTIVLLSGIFLCYWAAQKWYQTGFELDPIYKWRDGNGAFIIILIGVVLIGHGVLKYIDYYYLITIGEPEEKNSDDKKS